MSGGSYDYTCFKIEQEYVGRMFDDELNDMMKDLYQVLHDLEWWQSNDIGEEAYRQTVEEFKSRWFGNRNEFLRQRLIRHLEKVKKDILET